MQCCPKIKGPIRDGWRWNNLFASKGGTDETLSVQPDIFGPVPNELIKAFGIASV